MKVIRTRGGVRIVDGDIILSELPGRPRASGTLIDVLAACATSLVEGDRLALLGFAAGGFLAPLRALGHAGRVEAVDLSTRWQDLYHEIAGEWGGDVEIFQDEASLWLQDRDEPYDVIVDDLSEEIPESVKKPWVSVALLPGIMLSRLKPGGLAVINLLPWPDVSWRTLIEEVRDPFDQALLITFDDYENRILIGGPEVPPARVASRAIRAALRSIQSRQADRIHVRSLETLERISPRSRSGDDA